jgi:hypothetical protein
MYRIIIESGWTADEIVFEHADKWGIVRGLALHRPEPEPVALDAGCRIEGPDDLVPSSRQIDQWIHDLACQKCGQPS